MHPCMRPTYKTYPSNLRRVLYLIIIMERPSTPPSQEMTRDQRIEARILYSIGMQYTKIVQFLEDKGQKITYRQVYYTYKTRATPTKRTGRPPRITASQTNELIEFISRLKANRRMPY